MKKKKISNLEKQRRKKLSKSLKKYWQSWEGKQRKHEYFKIPKGKGKQFREKEKVFRSKERGEYGIRLYERQPKGGYEQVPIESFKKNVKYHIYIFHRKTKRSRLFASGKFNELPVASLKQTREWFKPFIGSSRKFNPLALKKKGKWIPITRFHNKAIQNIEQQADKRRKEGEGYKVRGAILPLKRLYNPELMIFSDEPIARKRKVRVVFAHVVTAYDYPNIRWISARHVKVEFKRGIRLDKLHEKLEEIEELAEEALQLEHPKAGVKALMVDGFIPVKFSEEKKKRRKR